MFKLSRRGILVVALVALFLAGFWNYALAVDLLPNRYGLADIPFFPGYLALHSPQSDYGAVKGTFGSLSLALATLAVFLGTLPRGFWRSFKLSVFVLALNVFVWTTVIITFEPYSSSMVFAVWADRWVPITNTGMWFYSLVVLLLLMIQTVRHQLDERRKGDPNRKLPGIPTGLD